VSDKVNPHNIVDHKVNPRIIGHKVNPQTAGYKVNPHSTGHTINPQIYLLHLRYKPIESPTENFHLLIFVNQFPTRTVFAAVAVEERKVVGGGTVSVIALATG
jgi:hypothetical protein